MVGYLQHFISRHRLRMQGAHRPVFEGGGVTGGGGVRPGPGGGGVRPGPGGGRQVVLARLGKSGHLSQSAARARGG
jgi:hypothetical protein